MICQSCRSRQSLPGRSLCEPCKGSQARSAKKRRNGRRAKGLCRECGLPSVPNRTKCVICLAKDVESKRWSARLKLYGITREQYQKMLDQQHGLCKICGRTLEEQTKGGRVDHDHKTGKVRGILCNHCNVGLHYLEDAVWNRNAQEYLKQ